MNAQADARIAALRPTRPAETARESQSRRSAPATNTDFSYLRMGAVAIIEGCKRSTQSDDLALDHAAMNRRTTCQRHGMQRVRSGVCGDRLERQAPTSTAKNPANQVAGFFPVGERIGNVLTEACAAKGNNRKATRQMCAI